MALSQFTYQVFQDQLETVVALEDAAVTEAAKKIAFYVAMLDAAIDDPFDDEEEQREILEYIQTHLTELTETYQSLVNNHL